MKAPYIIRPGRLPVFPDFLRPDENGLVAAGGDLGGRTLVEAYRKGIFPWVVGPPILWFSPDPRLVLFPEKFHLSKRLARTIRQGRYTIGFDRDFVRVIAACAAVSRKDQDGTWIGPEIGRAYLQLHRSYLAHCVSVYRQGILVGGLYGVALGRIFYGESMFAVEPNASKIALYSLNEWLKERQFLLIDCQQVTPHMLSLGAEAISRSRFGELLSEGLKYPDLNYRWELTQEK